MKVFIAIAVVLLVGCSDGPHMSKTDPERWCAGTDPQAHMGRCDGVSWQSYEQPQKKSPATRVWQ